MMKYNTETKAWKVALANVSVLSMISGIPATTFLVSQGWILVEDWSCSPRFLLMPDTVFGEDYAGVALTELKTSQ
jgi:hypothetical protein